MACCAFVLRLLMVLARPLVKPDVERRSGTSFGGLSLAVLSVVEIAIAGAVAWVWSTSLSSSEKVAGPTPVAGHSHLTERPVRADAYEPTTLFPALLAITAVALVLLTAYITGGRDRRFGFAVGAGIALVAAFGAASSLVHGSHVVLMLLIEAVLVLAPLCIVGTVPRTGTADDVWVVARAAVAICAAVASAAFLVSVHLPDVHSRIIGEGHVPWWFVAAGLITGIATWASCLRFRLPARLRQVSVLLTLELGSLLGIAMIVAAQPLATHSGSLLDQRLAGGVMMAVDLCVLFAVWPKLSGGTKIVQSGARQGDAVAVTT